MRRAAGTQGLTSRASEPEDGDRATRPLLVPADSWPGSHQARPRLGMVPAHQLHRRHRDGPSLQRDHDGRVGANVRDPVRDALLPTRSADDDEVVVTDTDVRNWGASSAPRAAAGGLQQQHRRPEHDRQAAPTEVANLRCLNPARQPPNGPQTVGEVPARADGVCHRRTVIDAGDRVQGARQLVRLRQTSCRPGTSWNTPSAVRSGAPTSMAQAAIQRSLACTGSTRG